MTPELAKGICAVVVIGVFAWSIIVLIKAER